MSKFIESQFNGKHMFDFKLKFLKKNTSVVYANDDFKIKSSRMRFFERNL